VTPDLNVLLAASRTDHPQHIPALRWLEQAIAGCATGGSIEVLPMVAAGFLRLASNPRVFPSPTPIRAAIDFIDSLLAVAGVEMPELGREWPTLREFDRQQPYGKRPDRRMDCRSGPHDRQSPGDIRPRVQPTSRSE